MKVTLNTWFGMASGVVAMSLLLAYANGCVGVIGGAGDDSSSADGAVGPNSRTNPRPADPTLKAALATARRLTATEIRNSVRDLYGIDISAFDWTLFPKEGISGKQFDNLADALVTTSSFTEPVQSAAEWAAQAAVAKLPSLLPCASTADGACAGTFIDTYAPRTYRRPITPNEKSSLLDLFTATRATADFSTSIATVIEAMLQSPNFLYRTELGAAAGSAVVLTSHETASALSYFLWQSVPDQALLDAAASGKLAARDDVATQVQRMLADPRAVVAAGSMFQQWLSSGGTLTKTDRTFSPALNQSANGEIATFVANTVWGGDHGFQDLFTSPSSYIDANLASLYGVSPPSGSGLVATALDPAKHSGFLTMPAFIGTFTGPTNRSPIQLGHFVRLRVLCQEVAPPPGNVPQPPSDPNLDEHARFEAHDSNAACAGCHKMMDPIGYGWSQFDVIGRFSPVDHRVTEDGSGALTGTDVDGAFKGPAELGKKLASSAQVQECFARKVLSWGVGRASATDANSSDSQAMKAANATGFATGDIKALFAAIATSDSFRFRDTTEVPEGGQ